MRIDKFISNNTDISRSQVRKLVKAGRISINDELVSDASQKLQDKNALVLVDGKPVKAIGHVYYMLNKPEGYVCANIDSEHPTVLDLLSENKNNKGGYPPKERGILKDLQIVGRLDIDTTGLVILTNDGDWNHRVTSPKSYCHKCYQVTLDSAPPENTAVIFANGVLLEGEKKKTKPAFMDYITHKRIRLSIREGKYHQVKRMFASVGSRVEKLHRESIGPIKLDPELCPGQYRELFPREVASVEKNPLIPENDD